MATIRHLIPVLGVIALAPSLMAEDKAPAVTFSGWSDNIFSVSDDNTTTNDVTARDAKAPSARFSAAASLKAAWKVGDKVTGKINAWFYPDAVNISKNPDGTAKTDNNPNLVVRESYFTYQVNDTIGIKGGKYIDHLGWISAEPTGLYLINGDYAGNGLLGYRAGTYGNDVLGAAVIITPKDSPVVGELHVTNGYFTATDAISPGYVAPNSPNRQNADLGYGFDLTFTPNEMVSVNFEGAYDSHSSKNAAADGALGGNVAELGLNATFKPIKDTLLIGAEIQLQSVGTGKDNAGAEYGRKGTRTQGMLLANYVLSGTPFPMSVTVSDQYINARQSDLDGASGPAATGLSTDTGGVIRQNVAQAALLTNPTGSANFGLNLEIGYFQQITEATEHVSPVVDGNAKFGLTGWETALEALVTF